MAGRTYANGALRSVIPELADDLETISHEIVEFVLVGIESQASAAAPIGPTGVLANSQTHESRRIPGGAEGEATSGADYSAYVNFGTGERGASSNVPNRPEEISYTAGWKGMSARPYFSQAAISGEEEWNRAWGAIESRLPRL